MLWRKKTVEDIVAPITRIVDELKDHADTHHGLANNHAAEADRRLAAEKAAREEANKANLTAGKISGLVG
jgi:hypothetical protein